jgi:dipeptidyl aminopeptidase/acylaminoacyl peptidase
MRQGHRKILATGAEIAFMGSDALSDLAALPELHHPSVSPAGDEIAYYWSGTGRNELHVHELSTGTRAQWTDSEAPSNVRYPLRWSRDGERVYVHRDDGGDERNDVFAIDRDGGVERVVGLDGRTILHDVSPDDRYLLVANSDAGQLNLYRHDRRDGDSVRVTDYDSPVPDAGFSPDGERVAYTTNESDDRDNTDVYVANADGSDARALPVGEDGYETAFEAWHPSGRSLLVADRTTDADRCGVYDLDAETVEWYGTDEFEEHPVAFTPDGSRVLALRLREAARVPVVLGPDCDREFDLPDGVASFPSDGVFLADGDAMVMHTTSAERRRLLAYDLDTHEHRTLVDADYGRFDPDAFVSAEYVTYDAPDSLEIGGLLYDSGERPSPAVVLVHGGPSSQALQYFDKHVQFLVGHGYTVFQPNYRGSTGRGRTFRDRIRGDWGGGDAMDVAEAGRWLASKPWIDEDRVAVAGGSYGGYATYTQLVRNPSLWWTGVAWDGITDLHRLHEELLPQFQAYLERQMGDPEADRDLWRDRSPVTHVERMERPVLVVHGRNDPRCPISQARLFRDALEDRGWEADEEFVYHELDKGHGTADADHRTRVFRLLDDYLGDWLPEHG